MASKVQLRAAERCLMGTSVLRKQHSVGV